ncbi:MAG: hypothetical protein ACRDWB_10845 [Acidimicrobiales bacterium]
MLRALRALRVLRVVVMMVVVGAVAKRLTCWSLPSGFGFLW